MNGYGQAYTNPLATGNSPDAQQAAIVAALQRLQGSSNQSSTGGVNVSPVSGASLSGLGTQVGGAPGAVSKLSSGLQTAGSAVDILDGLSQIYLGFQANKLAKKDFNFQVGAYNNNLQNTTQSYNTALEDRIRARHNTEGRSASDTTAYLDKNRLTANTLG